MSVYTLFWILFGGLVLVMGLIFVLLRRRSEPKGDDHIPGVEEMAKTYYFWSRYHGQNEDD